MQLFRDSAGNCSALVADRDPARAQPRKQQAVEHAAQDIRQIPLCSSNLVVPGFFGMPTMCAVVHSLGAGSPESMRFITRVTSLATQWMRSASMGTSSRPSAFWASVTMSAVLTGAVLKSSSDGSSVSVGRLKLFDSGGGGALTMAAAKNVHRQFLHSSAVS